MTTTLTRHHDVADRTAHLVLEEFRGRVHSIVLYGSVARGAHTEDSDVDILVIADDTRAPDSFSETLTAIETASGPLPQLLLRSPEEVDRLVDMRTWFIQDVLSQGVPLYDDGTFDAIRARAIQDGVMNGTPTEEFVRLQLDMANEALEASAVTRGQGLLRSTVDRAYYAAHHAAIAILSHHGVRPPKSHRGLVSVFGSEIVNRGIVPSELGRTLAMLHRDRMHSNYEARAQVTEETADRTVTSTRRFVETVRVAIDKA